MDKLTHIEKETPNGSQLNLDALYKIAPSCFTEAKGDDGEIHHVVDFNKLRLLLGDNTVEDAPEVYDFTWVGKRAALKEAAEPIRKTLRPCPEESVDWDTTQNLYIEGDNLEVLKLLQNSYMGKIKMIYIDPPYNTGNDFVYHDDFAMNTDDYDDANRDENGNRYRRNTDSNGRFHSDWCSMMYSRLMVARSLLSENGVIFISIGEQELNTLISCCNEVFGEQNKVIVYNRVTKKSSNNGNNFSPCMDYVLVYAKCLSCVKEYQIGMSDDIIARYNKKDEYYKERGPYQEVGLFMSALKHGGSNYPIECPDGSFAYPPNGQPWRWNEATFLKGKAEGRIVFKETRHSPLIDTVTKTNSNWNIYTKVYLKEREESGMHPKNFSDEYQNTLATNELRGLNIPFDFPKPSALISFFASLQTDNDDIILDFFSGSASTAHAILQLNAKDDANRKFIMVQLPEETDVNSDAYKAGYKNICEIGKERIRRAGKKIKEASPLTTQDLDVGFRVFKCSDSNYKDVAFAPKDYKQDQLEAFVDNIKSECTDLDLLFDCMLRWGIELSLPLQSAEVDGCAIHNVNDGDLVACLKGIVTEDVIDAIAEMHPVRVVFRDNSFTEAAQKMNLFELFKQKCGWSDEEVRNNVRVI